MTLDAETCPGPSARPAPLCRPRIGRRSIWIAASWGLLAAIAIGLAPARAAAGATPIVATAVGGSYDQPVYVTGAPGRPGLVFVVERTGIVRLIRRGSVVERPFLNLRDRITSSQHEQGLVSIAFDPDYSRSGLFYAYFTNRGCDSVTAGCDLELAEFRRRGNDPTRALAASYRRVLTIPHRDEWSHNGGTAMFGPDGKLWIATGDGGGADDPHDNARHSSNLLGKLLRINPRRRPARPGRPGRGYRVPPDNPFVGVTGRNEIWSIGLRNPFRFSFDAERGAIAIGDVGQGSREEVDIVSIADAKGANFGWPEWEGDLHRDASRPGPGERIEPVYTYDHTQGSAVIGGVTMRDPRFDGGPFDAGLGRYLFQDGYFGSLQSLVPDVAAGTYSDYLSPGLGLTFPAGFGTDALNRVYIAARVEGRVYRLDPPA